MRACTGIDAGDWLSFSGSLVGALAGILAAFLAVYLQRRSQSGDTKRTIVGLLNELQTAADLLKDDCGTRPAQAVRRVHRAFSALRDTALAVRTSSFGMASLAARMEYTTVWPEIERLMAANGGIALADGVARASEISELCSDLQNLLAGD